MKVLSKDEILTECGRGLGLTEAVDIESLLRPLLRRAVFILAPCSAADLTRFVVDPLEAFGDLRERTEQALQEMIVYGDILQMKKLESDAWDAPAYVLRPAPPSFVVRSAGEVIILGVAGELSSALPSALASDVKVEGPVRVLRGNPSELIQQLRLLGLSELSEHAWLHTPPNTKAGEYVNLWRARLDAIAVRPFTIDGLEVLDVRLPQTNYAGRWREPAKLESGWFVARRTQAYGSKLWSLVEIAEGVPQRLLDLFGEEEFQRPCDLAWRIQAAFDFNYGTPQVVCVEETPDGVHLDFQLPIPAFAERRLSIVGTKIRVPGVLFRFRIPKACAVVELAALQSTMWMDSRKKGEAR